MLNNMENTKGFLIGFLAGSTVGAIIVLLTTPKSGKEFRGDLKQKSEEYLSEADKYLAGLKNKTNQMVAEAKRKYALVIEDIKSKPEEILNDVERNIHSAKEKAKDVLHSSVEQNDENNKKKTRNNTSSK